MKKNEIKIIIIIIIAVFCYAMFFMNTMIFEVKNINEINELKNINEKKVCVLEYSYTTGSGWFVVDSNDSDLLNKEIILYSKYDPRLLKENKEFSMDYNAKYFVIIDDIWEKSIDTQKIMVISAKNIIIDYDTSKKNFKLYDMSVFGIAKSVLGIFFEKYRYSL